MRQWLSFVERAVEEANCRNCVYAKKCAHVIIVVKQHRGVVRNIKLLWKTFLEDLPSWEHLWQPKQSRREFGKENFFEIPKLYDLDRTS